jgi:hypothetical protein
MGARYERLCRYSGGCIHAVKKETLQEHGHKSILQDIGRTIEASAVPVHIWKVKSHLGIVGNETADKTAVGVANGTLYEIVRQVGRQRPT